MTKVNLDKVQAVAYGNLESVVSETDVLPNGVSISLGELMDGQREIREALPAADDKEQLIVATVEVKYDDNTDNLDFEAPVGFVARAVHTVAGDLVQVEQSLFAATPAVGDIVTGDANYTYKTAAGTEVTQYKVLALTKFGFDRRDMALIQRL